MKKGLLTSLSMFLLVISTSGCGGCVQSNGNPNENGTNSSLSSFITIKPGDKVVLDSNEKFVQVYILFNLEQKKWFSELGKASNANVLTEEQIGNVLKAKINEFYQNIGLTEDAFIQYSTEHAEEIQAFLDKNPAYKKAYEDSLKN